jgi:hypothetical protein
VADKCLVCEKSREGLSDDKVPTHEAIASWNRMNDLLSFELVLESCQLLCYVYLCFWFTHFSSFLLSRVWTKQSKLTYRML